MSAETALVTLLAGTTVGRYQILEPLGQGGMATVYKAFQPSLQREVALKVLRPGYAHDKEFLERFEREAIAVARLRHPHIVQVFDFESADGQYFLAMEFLDGGTLKDRLAQLAARGRGMDPRETVRVIGEVAGALTYAHEKGVVHRDVKPSNVMLNEKDRAVVTDFGIARILGATSHTQTGVGIGTPEYMAPEQGLGSKVDHRADIYSLGAMTYEMLTGRVPFVADTPLAVVLAHVKDPLPLPSVVNPTIGPAVEKVLLKALAKDPADRFASATDLATALRESFAADEAAGTVPTIVIRPTSSAVPGRGIAPFTAVTALRNTLRRSPALAAVAAGAVLLALAGTATLVGSFTTTAPTPSDAALASFAAARSMDPATADPAARPTTVARDVQASPFASPAAGVTAPAATAAASVAPLGGTSGPTPPAPTQGSVAATGPAPTPTLPSATAPAPTATLPPATPSPPPPTPEPPAPTIDPAAPKHRITGRVTSAVNGSGLGGVQVAPSFTERCCGGLGSTTTDGQGNFTLLLPDGSYAIAYFPDPSSGYAPAFFGSARTWHRATPVVISAADRSGIDAVVATGYAVSGRVTDASGRPVGDANVIAHIDDNVGGHVYGARADSNGRYLMRLANGDYQMQFYPAGECCHEGTPRTLARFSVRGQDVTLDGRSP